MANVKRGNLTAPPQWWQHLRWTKRDFWKGERQAHKAAISAEIDEPVVRTDGGDMTMNEMHGDGSGHKACQDCGMCQHCGDCECPAQDQTPKRIYL